MVFSFPCREQICSAWSMATLLYNGTPDIFLSSCNVVSTGQPSPILSFRVSLLYYEVFCNHPFSPRSSCMNEIIGYLAFCAWCIAGNITASSPIHIVANRQILSPLMTGTVILSCMSTLFSLSVHQSMGLRLFPPFFWLLKVVLQ